MPTISVIIPAHNVAPHIGETLASVLDQSARDLQIIVVDDGSTDATTLVIDQFADRFARRNTPLTIVHRRQGGAGAARNDALDRATGEFLCFVDADDRLHRDALALLADRLHKDRALDLIFPFCRHIDPAGEPLGIDSGKQRLLYSAHDLMVDNPIHTGTGVMLRRKRAEAAGRFDTGLPACIDLDYWIRATEHRPNNIAALPTVLVDYRFRPGQITSDWRRMRLGWEMMVQRAASRGLALDKPTYTSALARNALVWSTVAYKHGDLKAARKLALEMWTRDLPFAVTDAHARIRTAACLTSLLPTEAHDWIRNRFKRTQGLANV